TTLRRIKMKMHSAFTFTRGRQDGLPFGNWGHLTLFRTTLIGVFSFLLFSSLPASAQAQLGGSVTKLTIKSDVLGEDRTILVRTPAGYEANKLRYPVLYMTDGDAHIAHTSSTIEFLARNGRISEVMVV